MRLSRTLALGLTLSLTTLALTTLATPSLAQFSGPSAQGRPATVAEVQNARLGTYVTLTGNVVDHQRSDYFTFRDSTGDIRVEIAGNVWQGREVTPETNVRIMGEVDRGIAGRYVWVKTLDIVQ